MLRDVGVGLVESVAPLGAAVLSVAAVRLMFV